MSRSTTELLDSAHQSLREILHRTGLDPTARAHMERALNHVTEAYIATNELGKARSVNQVVSDIEKLDSLLDQIKKRDEITAKIKGPRI